MLSNTQHQMIQILEHICIEQKIGKTEKFIQGTVTEMIIKECLVKYKIGNGIYYNNKLFPKKFKVFIWGLSITFQRIYNKLIPILKPFPAKSNKMRECSNNIFNALKSVMWKRLKNIHIRKFTNYSILTQQYFILYTLISLWVYEYYNWNAQQTSQLFQKALSSISKTVQIGIYFQMIKFLIVSGALIFNFCFCKVSDIDGWAIIFLLDVAYTLVHTKNFKLQLGDNDKIQNIAITLGQGNADLMHPSRIEVQQMAYNVRKLIMSQNLDLQRESKYLMILGQILVFRFIIILTKYPFTINVFDYFDGHCNDTLLQVCMIMFISFLIEFIAIYFLVIFVALSIPIIIVLLMYRKLRKYIEIYRAKKYLNSFQTHDYLGETDEWTKNQNECSICMQEYKLDEKIMRLPCNSLHMFHQACIKSWFEVSTECPLCRTKLIQQNQEQI